MRNLTDQHSFSHEWSEFTTFTIRVFLDDNKDSSVSSSPIEPSARSARHLNLLVELKPASTLSNAAETKSQTYHATDITA